MLLFASGKNVNWYNLEIIFALSSKLEDRHILGFAIPPLGIISERIWVPVYIHKNIHSVIVYNIQMKVIGLQLHTGTCINVDKKIK